MTAAITFRSESSDYYTVILEGPDYKESLRKELEELSGMEEIVMLSIVSTAGDVNNQLINSVKSEYEVG